MIWMEWRLIVSKFKIDRIVAREWIMRTSRFPSTHNHTVASMLHYGRINKARIIEPMKMYKTNINKAAHMMCGKWKANTRHFANDTHKHTRTHIYSRNLIRFSFDIGIWVWATWATHKRCTICICEIVHYRESLCVCTCDCARLPGKRCKRFVVIYIVYKWLQVWCETNSILVHHQHQFEFMALLVSLHSWWPLFPALTYSSGSLRFVLIKFAWISQHKCNGRVASKYGQQQNMGHTIQYCTLHSHSMFRTIERCIMHWTLRHHQN